MSSWADFFLLTGRTQKEETELEMEFRHEEELIGKLMQTPVEVNTSRSRLMKERQLLISNNFAEDDELIQDIDKQLEALGGRA